MMIRYLYPEGKKSIPSFNRDSPRNDFAGKSHIEFGTGQQIFVDISFPMHVQSLRGIGVAGHWV